MTDFSARVEAISISGIREVFEAAGEDAINLGLGQPDFPTPEHARGGAIEAIRAGKVDAYTSNKGTESLRAAIADKHARGTTTSTSTGQYHRDSGRQRGAAHRHRGPRRRGRGGHLPRPRVRLLRRADETRRRDAEARPLRDDLTMDPATVGTPSPTTPPPSSSTAPRTRPARSSRRGHASVRPHRQRPRRAVHLRRDVRTHRLRGRPPLARGVRRHRQRRRGQRLFEELLDDRVATRLGDGSNERVERMLRVHQYAQACAAAPSQYAAEAALNGPQDAVAEMSAAFEERRDVLVDGLADAGLDCPTPQGAFYAMPKVPEGSSTKVIDRGVVVVPGDAFGEHGAGYARISYAVDVETLKEALEIMDDAAQAVRQ